MNKKNGPTRVLHVTPEMAPLEKKGGLGDVLGSLPKALRQLGQDARVLLPAYPDTLDIARTQGFPVKRLEDEVHVALDWRVFSAHVWQVDIDSVPVYLLDQPELFNDPAVYPRELTSESVRPFAFLSMAAFELPKVAGWQPQVLHAHDWPAAMVPIALRWHTYYSSLASQYDTVFSIHNLAHQGMLPYSRIGGWGLRQASFSIEGLEFYGQANLLKGAMIATDAIVTVSPRYSWEIQTRDGGMGLDGVLQSLRGKLHGILNGIDYDTWNPKIDPRLPANYSAANLKNKEACRKSLMARCGWQDDGKPTIAFIGRLVQQKGVDILLGALDWLLSENCRMVVLGTGQSFYGNQLRDFQNHYPDYFYAYTEMDEDFAHLLYAGADILIMPSLFEPCGLSQLIAMAYGTIPVVRATGGLADTVIDVDGSPDGTGFIFSDFNSDELCKALFRAIQAYYDRGRWHHIIANAMKADFSWNASAKIYNELYAHLADGESF